VSFLALGQTETDSVTVTGNRFAGFPTGKVTFYVCGPTTIPAGCLSQATQIKKPVKLTKAGNDSSTATSGDFTPSATGVWCFAAYYSGNANYVMSTDTDVDECFTVTPRPVPCSLMVTVSPNPLVETGQSNVEAVVQVNACASFAGDAVSIEAGQLEDSCASLTFENLQSGGTTTAPHVSVDNIVAYLDDDGNLTVVMNGTDCAPGQSVVEADLDKAPYLTALTTLQVDAPVVTAAGVTGTPNPETETGDTNATGNSDVYAVFYVETDAVDAEETVEIDSAQLFASCGQGVSWTSNQGSFSGATATATLDDDGNAVFVFMGASCAAGISDVITTGPIGSAISYTTNYSVLPPSPNL
jgi:hypothetical protein